MPSANQRISEYLLDAPIGSGAFGQVWRAHHHVWADQKVAIKLPTDPQFVRNLQQEGAAIHGLVNANIVRAIGFDPYSDPPYLVMEYVPGKNLRQAIPKGGFPSAQAISILRQVLAGLSYAHKSNVIHRDLKPENVLVHERSQTEGYDTPGVIKITDFGLGKAATKTAAGSIAYSASMNDPAGREIAGTLDYMSPEQRSGSDLDGRSDLYAAGVILFELLTGERPAGTDCPSDLNASVPKYLDEVFKRSYARLDKRYASADEFAAALKPAGTATPPPLKPHLPFTRTMCSHCQKSVDAGDQFCMHCGTQLIKALRRCGHCGGYPDVNDRFCIHCGKPLAGALQTG